MTTNYPLYLIEKRSQYNDITFYNLHIKQYNLLFLISGDRSWCSFGGDKIVDGGRNGHLFTTIGFGTTQAVFLKKIRKM